MRRLHGTLHTHRFDSPLLADNPLGDPSDRDLFVYTPPGHDGPRGAHLPLVMLLPGYGSTNHNMLNHDTWQPNVVERFDALVASGQSEPAVLVLPDAMTRWGGSQFVDSAATGPYQRYLVEELLPLVERHHRTIPHAHGRAVVGRSSGGFGALRLGLDRPEAFGVIGSHAGDSAFDVSIRPDLTRVAIELDRAGGAAAFVQAFMEQPGRHSFLTMMTIAYAAAYAPELDARPVLSRLPVDPQTGAVDEQRWARWRAQDPLVRVQQDVDAFSDAALVFLDAGNRDEHGLHFGSRQIAALLQARGRSVVYEEFDGGHRGTGHRYDVSLPRLVGACRG